MSKDDLNMTAILYSFALKHNGNWDKIYSSLENKEKINIKAIVSNVNEINDLRKNNIEVYSIIEDNYPKEFQTIYKPPFVLFKKNGKYTEHPSLKKFYTFNEIFEIKENEMKGIETVSTRYEKDILDAMHKKASKEVKEGKVVNISDLFSQAEKIASQKYEEENKIEVLIEDHISDDRKQYPVGNYLPNQVKEAIFNELAEYAGYSDEEIDEQFGSINHQDYQLDKKFNLISPNKKVNLGFDNDKKIILKGKKKLINEVASLNKPKKLVH